MGYQLCHLKISQGGKKTKSVITISTTKHFQSYIKENIKSIMKKMQNKIEAP